MVSVKCYFYKAGLKIKIIRYKMGFYVTCNHMAFLSEYILVGQACE